MQVNSVECQQTNLQKVSNICQKHRANSQVANGNSLLPHDRFEKQGGAATPTRGDGRLIVYGITGTHNDVSSSVLDTPYVVENGKMVMETDLDLNGKRLLNLNYPKSKAVIFGKLYKIRWLYYKWYWTQLLIIFSDST